MARLSLFLRQCWDYSGGIGTIILVMSYLKIEGVS
jgi:hypothetical protein